MTLKARKGVPAGIRVSRETSRARELDEDYSEGHPDELVMVMFPRITYNAFMELTEQFGAGSVAETMNYALKLLKETLDKQKAAG